ncbi:AAA family ATPase [Aliagarivorans marinus]|uniref:AAA family ATPase n=1 Tax=Aliagarivorans marinus TaxID=561965 RepID=UPI0003F9E19B|nr:ATP-binding protein [Aliagarivorans marinus]
MASIYFLCGFIGSGKSTYAKRLAKQQQAFIFSPDEWMIPMFGEHMPRELFDQRLNTFKRLFERSALQLLELGTSVIFDSGYWSKAERAEAKAWAEQHQLDYQLVYIATPKALCFERAQARNATAGEQAFQMDEQMLELFWSKFELPSEEELAAMQVIKPSA